MSLRLEVGGREEAGITEQVKMKLGNVGWRRGHSA